MQTAISLKAGNKSKFKKKPVGKQENLYSMIFLSNLQDSEA